MGVIYDENVQVRKLPSFTSIRVSNAIELYISQSSKTEVAVSAKSDEYRNRIVTEVVGGTLIIRMEDNYKWWKWSDDFKAKAYVSVKDLYALTGSGATNIKIINGLQAEKLKITLSGASDLRGDIKAADMIMDRYYGKPKQEIEAKHEGEITMELLEHSICPHCGSKNTDMKTPFGPTLCRSMHYCNDCLQAFEQFKPVV
jgi:hypothetical protein